ncbi:MAG: MFS transporter [Armatimonadetes bacterium]|nr:MFS transporter [Armatimonadota bacterium]
MTDNEQQVIESPDRSVVSAVDAPNPDGAQSLSDRDIRHNMIVLIMIDAIWGLGATEIGLASSPLYVFLHASNTIIGFATGTLAILALVGVFFSPFITLRFRVKKWYLLIAHLPYLGAWGLIGLALIMSGRLGLSREWLLTFVVVMSGVNWFFAGFVSLPHNEYAAACIPMSHRGRFAGYSHTIGAIAGLLSNAVGGLILLQVAKPMAYGYLHVMTWFICQCGYILALFGRERPTPVEKAPKPWSKSMIKAAVTDKPYLRVIVLFVAYNILFIPCITTFVGVYGFRELKMIPAAAATIGFVQKFAVITLSAYVGRIIDKYSPKRVLTYWPLVMVLSLSPLLILHNSYGVYISAGFGMLFYSGYLGSFNALIYGMPSPENRAGHTSRSKFCFLMPRFP